MSSHQPWLKFYPADWRADPALRMCSLAARGLWIEMLCLMHEAECRGDLTVSGRPVTNPQLASLVGMSTKQINNLVQELESNGVFSRTETGLIFSRRIRKDSEKALKDQDNGKLGGNPKLKGWDNPPDKAQKPDTRNQIVSSLRSDNPSSSVPSEDSAIEPKSKSKKPTNEAQCLAILEEVLSPETAADFMAHRKAKKSPVTPGAAKGLVKNFKLSGDCEAAAQMAMANGWTGYNPIWAANARDGPSNREPKPTHITVLKKDFGYDATYDDNSSASNGRSARDDGFPLLSHDRSTQERDQARPSRRDLLAAERHAERYHAIVDDE